MVNKITVIGGGHVGETCSLLASQQELAKEVILLDIIEGMPQDPYLNDVSDPVAPTAEVEERESVDLAGTLKDVLGDLTTGLRDEVRKELNAALGRVS